MSNSNEAICELITADEFFQHRNGSYAMFLYFSPEKQLMRASVASARLNHDCDTLQDIIKGAINNVGYLRDDDSNVFFKTQEPIFVNDESEWHYMGISVINETAQEFFFGMVSEEDSEE